MAEYPEIANLTRQLGERLSGRTITSIEVLQPKCLNIDPSDFCTALIGANIHSTSLSKIM
jgi:formamidopyrimidine-DNA glycosylase